MRSFLRLIWAYREFTDRDEVAFLLPEDEMRRYLADRANVNPEREFFLLWVLGQDLTGAITIEPADGEELPPSVRVAVDDDIQYKDGAMRFSLAGVQLKFSAVQHAAGGWTDY